MTERATRTSSSIAIALCTAAVSLVASPGRALQALEAFLSAARERNPDAQQARASLDQQNAEAFTALGRQLPGVLVAPAAPLQAASPRSGHLPAPAPLLVSAVRRSRLAPA